MCIKTPIDALALRELGDAMNEVAGGYPSVPGRRNCFSERFRDDDGLCVSDVVSLVIPEECYNEEKEFLQRFSSVQDGEVEIRTLA